MRTALSFDDVLLVPQYSEIFTRKDIKIQQKLKGLHPLRLPIISSPMDTVTEDRMACAMHKEGGVGIIHRYNTVVEQASMVAEVRMSGHQVGAAIGVGDTSIERAKALVEAGVNFLCIDVAHGHHAKARYALQVLKNTFGDEVHLMAGNVATLEAFNDLGMASKEAQRSWRNRVSSIEGVSHTVPLKGPVADVLGELRTGITSGISYSGADSVLSLQSRATFIRQTQSGQVESSTHIKRI